MLFVVLPSFAFASDSSIDPVAENVVIFFTSYFFACLNILVIAYVMMRKFFNNLNFSNVNELKANELNVIAFSRSRVQILKIEYKYFSPLCQSDCRSFFVLAIIYPTSPILSKRLLIIIF